MNKNRIVILGGDKRIEYLHDYLYSGGFNIKSFLNGAENNFDCSALKDADTLILGMPVSRDRKTIFAPSYNGTPVKLKDITASFEGKKIFGGILPPVIYENAPENCECIDYSELEDLMILNAISTAEGAIEVIMKNTDFTLCSSNIIIIGNGRIGKIMAKMLTGIGARVTVTARKEKDFAYIEAMGMNFYHSNNLREILPKADVIINTVPHTLLDESDYRLIKKDAFVIDLASMPGYINKKLCEANSIKFEHALSLPGKAAPQSAGNAIYRAILPYL